MMKCPEDFALPANILLVFWQMSPVLAEFLSLILLPNF